MIKLTNNTISFFFAVPDFSRTTPATLSRWVYLCLNIVISCSRLTGHSPLALTIFLLQPPLRLILIKNYEINKNKLD